MNEYILELIENKEYNELNNNELVIVLEHISTNEYKLMRKNILALTKVFNEEIESIEIDSSILDKVTKEKNGFIRLMNTKVTLIKVAAIFIFVLFGYTLLLVSTVKNSNTQTILSKIDTIYKTEWIKNTDTVFIVKETPTDKRIKFNKLTPTNTKNHKKDIQLSTVNQRDYKNIYANHIIAQIKEAEQTQNNGISSKYVHKFGIIQEVVSDEFCAEIEDYQSL